VARRPRIGSRIADALLIAENELDNSIDDLIACQDDYIGGDYERTRIRDLKIAVRYIGGVARWYREREGIE